MINTADILETIHMIREENLDIRTVTMGISLYDCVSDDIDRLCANVYDKIMSSAKNLVSCCEGIEKLYGIPIVNKRVSVTPISQIGGAAQWAKWSRSRSATPPTRTQRRKRSTCSPPTV